MNKIIPNMTSATIDPRSSNYVAVGSMEVPPAKRKKPARFMSTWTLPPGITASTRGPSFAYCRLCQDHFSVAHGGFNDVTRHVQGKGHAKRFKDTDTSRTIQSFVGQSSTSLSSKVMQAEVVMCNFIAQHNLSFQTADHLTDLLPKIFPDSKIAAGFACKRTKTTAIICDALEPHFLEPVVNTARSKSFNLLCDESNERGDRVKLLTILLRMFEVENSQIVTRHLETVGITDLTADGIFGAIQSTLVQHGLSFTNMVSFSSDTCNVMKGARNGVIAKLREQQPKVVDIHCNCHVLNLCVKAAVKVLPLKVDELLVDIFYHFHHSVKRVASLQEYADFCNVEFKSILSHCETRWLSLSRSVNRTLEMWEPLLSYFSSHPDVEKSGKVKTIATVLNHDTTKVYLFFMSDMLAIFDKVNVSLQSSSISKVRAIQSEMIQLLKRMLSFLIHPGEIRSVDDLTKVEYSDQSKQLQDDDLFVGDRALALLCHLSDNEGEVSTTRDVYAAIRKFHAAFIKKLLKAFQFSSRTFTLLSYLDPTKVMQAPLATAGELCSTFAVPSDREQVQLEFREFLSDAACMPTDADTDVVQYWLRIKSIKASTGHLLYSNLSSLVLQLLAIPVSNADSERVFSLVRRIRTDFRASLSTSSLSSLIGYKFNKTSSCCQFNQFPDSFLQRAKTCTRERNRASLQDSSQTVDLD